MKRKVKYAVVTLALPAILFLAVMGTVWAQTGSLYFEDINDFSSSCGIWSGNYDNDGVGGACRATGDYTSALIPYPDPGGDPDLVSYVEASGTMFLWGYNNEVFEAVLSRGSLGDPLQRCGSTWNVTASGNGGWYSTNPFSVSCAVDEGLLDENGFRLYLRPVDGATQDFRLGEATVRAYEVDLPPPPPPWDPHAFGNICVYTHTNGITTTTSANVLGNPSFEYTNYDTISNWSVQGGYATMERVTGTAYDGSAAVQYDPGAFQGEASIHANTGIDAGTQDIAAGVMARGSGGSGSSTVSVLVDGQELATATIAAGDDWTAIAGTLPISDTGGSYVDVAISVEGSDETLIDAAWVYQGDDATGAFLPLCPAPEEPPGGVIPPPPVPGIDDYNIPQPGDWGVCYDCNRPSDWLSLGQWIAWLLCGLGNLFRCELYNWLLMLANYSRGMLLQLAALFTWLWSALQAILSSIILTIAEFGLKVIVAWDNFRTDYADILMQTLNAFLNSNVMQAIWVSVQWVQMIFEYLWNLAQSLMGILEALYHAVVALVELLQTMVQAVAAAWHAPDGEFFFLPGSGPRAPLAPADLQAVSGVSADKVVWLVLVAIGSFDSLFAGYGLEYLQFVVIGVVGFGVIAWTLRQFHDIVPV